MTGLVNVFVRGLIGLVSVVFESFLSVIVLVCMLPIFLAALCIRFVSSLLTYLAIVLVAIKGLRHIETNLNCIIQRYLVKQEENICAIYLGTTIAVVELSEAFRQSLNSIGNITEKCKSEETTETLEG